jgi:hypothetical protein
MYSFFGDLLRDSRRTLAAPVLGLGFRNGNISLLSSIANRDHQIFLAVATRCASVATHDSRVTRPTTDPGQALQKLPHAVPPADRRQRFARSSSIRLLPHTEVVSYGMYTGEFNKTKFLLCEQDETVSTTSKELKNCYKST